MNAFEFHCPTKIVCGEGALHKLPVKIADRGVTKPLIVTDANLIKLGIAEQVFAPLREADVNYSLYDHVPPDSSLNVVNEVATLYREEKCDGWIALGGGSVIDTAKGAAASVSVGEKDFTDLQGSEILQDELDPLIAIPTTAGTGSEVTLVAVVADTEHHAKLSYTSYRLVPHIAFLDPKLTASLPPRLTATTGIDALTHAIEAYIQFRRTPLATHWRNRPFPSSARTWLYPVQNRETLKRVQTWLWGACWRAHRFQTPWWGSFMQLAIP